MKPVLTLVLLASESEARILENAGVGHGLSELETLSVADFPDADQEFTDAPGRALGGGGARQGLSTRETVREARRSVFSSHVIEALKRRWQKGSHNRIVIAAAPRLLGELRAQMPKDLAKGVTVELAKDIVKVPLRDLPGRFNGIAVF